MVNRASTENPSGTSPATKPAEYDLWFDESGRFTETSTRSGERDRTQRFPSQLAGLLVRRGSLSPGSAEIVLEEAHRAAKLRLGEEVHGTEIAQASFEPLMEKLISEIRSRGWQPVRLVNREGVSYGDRVATYTRMVAELILRVLRELSARGEPCVDLRVYGALVVTAKDTSGAPELLSETEYDERIQEALAFVAVRRGVASELSGWRVAGIELLSGRRRRELQICDLISNASHASFKRLGPEVRKALEVAFGPFDQSLVIRELFERVDDLVRELSFGRALMLLAESAIDPAQPASEGSRQRLGAIVGRLAALGARMRDPELAALVNWLEQVIEHQRSLADGRKLAAFLAQEVEAPLRKRLEAAGSASALDWFTYALHRWTLTANNHLGDLIRAKSAAVKLDQLTSALTHRWEHSPLLIQGMIAQAVHRTDCFAFDDASARMKLVAGYYRELSGLFSAAMPDVFPDRIRSNARGEALGTWLQSEMYAGLRDATRLNVARQLSDEAIAEFATDDDKARQRQYRCHIETLAGVFAAAREFLAQSLGLASTTHDAIGKAIVGLENPHAQGFALLHWLRLGRAASMFLGAERDDFLAAVRAWKIFGLRWLTGGFDDYPVHGILRQAAGIHAILNAPGDVLGSLTHLRQARAGLVLSTIVLASTVEVAGLLWAKHRKDAERFLDNKDKQRPGALQLLQALGHEARDGVPELWAVFESWEPTIRRVLTGGAVQHDPREVLLGLARVVPY
ncbi:hypothetical protein [Sorangium sp. So ce1151]|uniref:hypothetical protein n=1 Tax=Sorangium sp. So ce1151 TaxID=3133332 RepID=UPI003F60D151